VQKVIECLHRYPGIWSWLIDSNNIRASVSIEATAEPGRQAADFQYPDCHQKSEIPRRSRKHVKGSLIGLS
jgi:hypothetical protein